MPSDRPTLQRPRQVTMAGWLIVVGSVLVVLSAFERISSLHSLETQEAISDFLSRPPGEDLGLTRDGAQSLLRVMVLVAAASAAAAAILGYQVLSRSRSARLALTVLAVPLFVAGMAVFGFLSALVVVSVLMLWLQPAKDWFNGVVPTPPVAVQPPPFPAQPPPAPAQLPHQPPMQQPPMQQAPMPPPPPGYHRPPPRPSAVTGACIVTWVTCGLALSLMALTVLVLVSAPDMLFDEIRRQDPDFDQNGLSESELRRAALIGCSIASVWCAAGIGFAVAAVNGYRWGWLALFISTMTAAVVSCVLMLGSLVMVVPLVASAVTVGLLLRPEAKAWCRRRPRGRGSVSP